MEIKEKLLVIILAAGEGTRLHPFTHDRPKCLVEISGKSLLSRQLKILATCGLRNILLIGGYKIKMLRKLGLPLVENSRFSETNMVWSLFCAEEYLEGEIIISYGDIVYSQSILEEILNSKSDIAVAIDLDWRDYWSQRSDNPLGDAETLKMEGGGRIIEIGKKPTSLDEIEGQYIGLMKFSAGGAQKLRDTFGKAKKSGILNGKTPESAYMTDLLQAIIDDGVEVDSVKIHGGWIEVDTIEDLQSRVTADRLNQIALSHKQDRGTF